VVDRELETEKEFEDRNTAVAEGIVEDTVDNTAVLAELDTGNTLSIEAVNAEEVAEEVVERDALDLAQVSLRHCRVEE
jgi:hypothetical protein